MGCYRRYISDDVWRPMLAKAGLEAWFVKVLAVLDHPTMDDVLAVAKANDISYMTDAELAKTAAKVCARCGMEEFDLASRKMAGMLGSMC